MTWTQQGPPVWQPRGSVKGPPGPAVEVVPYSMQGLLRVVDSVGRFPIDGPTRILSISAMVEDAPSGSPIVLDVLASGLSIFTTSNRPTIEPGSRTAVVGPHIDRALISGDYLNVDVVQIGSGSPGAYLTVAIRLERGGDTTP